MICINLEKYALDWDAPAAAQQAYAAGWRIEQDDWWVRPVRDGEPREQLRAGDCFIARGHVYAPRATEANRYDAALSPSEREATP